MSNSFLKSPTPINEPVKSYGSNTPERLAVTAAYDNLFSKEIHIPMKIGGEEIDSSKTNTMHPPHDHKHCLGTYSLASETHVEQAIAAALEARKTWAIMSFAARAAVFLKAAELIAGPYRYIINASTMIAQSKTVHQAEIDAACEFIDFLRFNVRFAEEIYQDQPTSSGGVWNHVHYRPLEGFIYAVSPFNFTAIAGNLSAAPALMGNTIVWKPSDHQMFSAKIIMDVFEEAGLPKGVINMINGDPEIVTNTVLKSPDFAGIHFTGSTQIFKNIWQKIGSNIHNFKTYPRIVGETGGKDYILVHNSAEVKEVATAIVRGAFEFQGQKCSAASRVYLPKSKSKAILDQMVKDIKTITLGSPRELKNFMTSVIHKGSFDRLTAAIEQAKKDRDVEVLIGGTYDDSKGYFINPTVLVTTNPKYDTMERELFGPVVTVYVYEDNQWGDTLKLVDSTSEYALTGAIMVKDRLLIEEARLALENSAGNFYINDKPSGAVVGQQPFGGARGSGTNDKAGSRQNLLRWVSPQLVKETLNPPIDYRYPYMDE
ncbi:MAG: 1-pyrroline-5-carboxylate dehydrogenase [Flavobacteriales bacterium]|jgi:1-pyrroline-5-carboxylate dehydrogenase|nr:1-pyrroline-5-carboxylate dehydrogenase [Candidatus Arcticimaribacter sp.]|tara:strand:+ start:1546 stop:3174 length:1629 start_codon:yes stop_codon:yes gene_type:complete